MTKVQPTPTKGRTITRTELAHNSYFAKAIASAMRAAEAAQASKPSKEAA